MKLVAKAGPEAGRELVLGTTPVTIGRDPAGDIVFGDGRVSWHHARVTVLPDGRSILEDLGSTNGTFVDGRRISERAFLMGGETVSLGGVELSYVLDGGPVASPPPPAVPSPAYPSPQPGQPLPPPDFQAYPPRRESVSVIQRLRLERSVKRANVLAGIAIAASIVLVAVLASGVLTPPAQPTPSIRTIADVVAQAEPSTVLVVSNVDGEREGSGTGWVLDAGAGLIVTNHHVINGGEAISVGAESMRTAEVLGSAPCDDLTLLRVADATGLVTLPLGSQSEIRRGDTAIALGYPRNATPTDDLQVTTGTVSAIGVHVEGSTSLPPYPNLIQTDTAINPGNSGGPLIDLSGRLTGVNTLTATTLQNVNYAVSVDRVKEVVPTMSQGTSMWWTGLGFNVYVPQALLDESETTRNDLARVGLPTTPGILMGSVLDGVDVPFPLPAYLVGVNGATLDGTLNGYCEAVAGTTDASVTLTVYLPNTAEPLDADMPFL